MPFDKTRAQNVDLHSLLEGIHEGEVVLPDFQRDFDWNDSDARALLATVLSGWPIGSLLLMQGPPTFFQVRSFDGAPQPSLNIAYIVLDGQQRLTALYQALFDTGKRIFAIRLDGLETLDDVDAIEESIVSFPQDQWRRRFPTPQSQFTSGLLPLSALRSAADFFVWRDNALRSSTDRDDPATTLTNLYRNFLAGIHAYDVPSIVVSSSIQPAAIARIFERVNRTGMRLGAFDLMVARSYAPNFNLRDKWRDAKEQYPRLQAFFGDDGLPILQALALRNRSDVRQQAILDLSGATVRDLWETTVMHVDQALDFATREFGIWGSDWAPYPNMLTVLAALAFDFELDAQTDLLSNWYWSTAMGGRYDAATNTRAVADYTKLLQREAVYTEPITLLPSVFLESTKKQRGALHRAFVNALAANHPRDLFSNVELTPYGLENGYAPEIESVSMFQYRGDDYQQGGEPLHLRTLGYVLSGRIHRKDLRPTVINAATPESLSSQFFPDSPPEDIGEFFFGRLAALAPFVEARAGVRVRIADESSPPEA